MATKTTLSDNKTEKPEGEIDYNHLSIVLLLQIGQAKILLTGDLDAAGEQALIKAGLTDQIHILKVGHHGSKTSSTSEFLDKLQPELAIISVGKNNKYHHPDDSVVKRLITRGIGVIRTDQAGEVVITFPGTHSQYDIECTQEC